MRIKIMQEHYQGGLATLQPKILFVPVTLVRCAVLTSQYKLTSDRPRRRKSEPTEQGRGHHSWSEEHYSTDNLEGCLMGMFFDPVQHFLGKLAILDGEEEIIHFAKAIDGFVSPVGDLDSCEFDNVHALFF
jgi:hypothetical protein